MELRESELDRDHYHGVLDENQRRNQQKQVAKENAAVKIGAVE
jgi:hypothetical protein